MLKKQRAATKAHSVPMKLGEEGAPRMQMIEELNKMHPAKKFVACGA
jgi:hypothetical protein